MWNRQEIKQKGKDRFRATYWKSVLVALILSVIGGGTAVFSGSSSRFNSSLNNIKINGGEVTINGSNLSVDYRTLGIAAGIAFIIFAVVFCIVMLLNVFVFNPLYVGGTTYFLKNTKEDAALGNIGYGFNNYGRVVLTMFLRDLFIFLWSLLFIIPGIIKAYSYRMVPYILADDPTLSGKEAITRSRQMMDGHKWRTFVLDLSFILWDLLSMITLGVVGAFYVEPYRQATYAELYQQIKAEQAY